MDTVEKTYDGFVSQQGGTVHVTDAETRLALTKRAVLGSIQSQSRSLSYCTPQSAKSTVTPSELNTSHSGGSSSSKREKFIQVSVEANPSHECEASGIFFFLGSSILHFTGSKTVLHFHFSLNQIKTMTNKKKSSKNNIAK